MAHLIVVLPISVRFPIVRWGQITYTRVNIFFRVAEIRTVSIGLRREDDASGFHSFLDHIQIMYRFGKFFQSVVTIMVNEQAEIFRIIIRLTETSNFNSTHATMTFTNTHAPVWGEERRN